MDKKLRILMLESNPADAEAIEFELRNGGIDSTVTRVETRQEFETQLEELAPDLVLSDYWLPTFDGPSALAITRAEAPGVPFIFVSSALGEELAIDTIREGATDYVLKVGLTRLLPAVRRAMREADDRGERKRAESRLRESEGRLKTILNSVDTGVLIIDPVTHRIIDANPAAMELFGFPSEVSSGRYATSLSARPRRGPAPSPTSARSSTGRRACCAGPPART